MSAVWVVPIADDGTEGEPTECHPRSIVAAGPEGLGGSPIGTVRHVNGITYRRVAPPEAAV